MSKAKVEELIQQINQIDNNIIEVKKPIMKEVNELEEQRHNLKEILDAEIVKMTKPKFKQKDYGCGTISIDTENFKIKTVIKKTVKWDEEKLKDVEKLIREGGQDPENFVKYKRSVLEASYKNFTDDIKVAFEPARSVEPSKPSISIERKEA